jgi:hypothetical protein
MLTKCAEVIKPESIEIGESICLGPAKQSGVGAKPPLRTSEPHAEISPDARILESNGEYVVIEVTCSCGCKSQIECRF